MKGDVGYLGGQVWNAGVPSTPLTGQYPIHMELSVWILF